MDRRGIQLNDRRILALALPAIAALAADPLYNLTDAAILGRLGTTELAGATIASEILLLTTSVFIFLMFATTAGVSRLAGAGDLSGAAHQGVQAIWLGGGLGLFAAASLAIVGPTLLTLWGADGAVSSAATTYLWWSLAGLPATLIVMAGTGFVRGGGNTVVPLWIALGTVALNLVGEVIAIYGLGMGVGASAGTTSAARWVGAMIYVSITWRSARRVHRSTRPSSVALRELGATGRPLFVRTAALRGTVAASVALASRYGEASLAGYGISFGIWAFLAYVSDGFEVAGQILVARELGAGSTFRARAIALRILRLSALLGVVIGAVVILGRFLIAPIFSNDPRVIAVTVASLLWVGAAQPLNAVVFSLDGILVGANDLNFLARAMICAAACFAVVAGIGQWFDAGLWSVWLAIATFMTARLIGLGVRFWGDRWAVVSR